jgi:hypothetical protein
VLVFAVLGLCCLILIMGLEFLAWLLAGFVLFCVGLNCEGASADVLFLFIVSLCHDIFYYPDAWACPDVARGDLGQFHVGLGFGFALSCEA